MTELLTIEQAARVLQVHERTVRRAIQSRGLKASQVAGRGSWRIRPEDLDAWLEQRANTSEPAPPEAAGTVVAHIPVARRAGRPRRGSGRLTVNDEMGRSA